MPKLPPLRTDTPPHEPYGAEHDACALFMCVNKFGRAEAATLKRALDALTHMGHRTGFVEGEGDGAGVQTDIPRALWAGWLAEAGLAAGLTAEPNFWVGHLFVPSEHNFADLRADLQAFLEEAGLNLLLTRQGRTTPEALGRNARANMPAFWQIAGTAEENHIEARLLEVVAQLENNLPLHFASLSTHSVVYKVQGSVEALKGFYPDLADPAFRTAMAICHSRYSTNTVSNFERAQPFHLMGHNGEINTIAKFRQEAVQINAELPRGGSDSQDVDRALHTLCVRYGLDLIEAMEYIFPPVPAEIELLPAELQQAYTRIRQAFGPYAQGPAAVVARFEDYAVASVDVLGLRPLWFTETSAEYFLSSERGAVPLNEVVSSPRPLAPGEKIALKLHRDAGVEVLTHRQMRQHVLNQASTLRDAPTGIAVSDWPGSSTDGAVDPANYPAEPGFTPPNPGGPAPAAVRQQVVKLTPAITQGGLPWQVPADQYVVDTAVLAATGWQREHLAELESMAEAGKEIVGSLGHDGPLATLSNNRVNLPDYFKETVAVVTNPAIDGIREAETFSTEMLVGRRPMIGSAEAASSAALVELKTPLLAGGHPLLGDAELARTIAEKLHTLSVDDLLSTFEGRTIIITLGLFEGETVRDMLDRAASDAVAGVQAGAACVLLDDSEMIRRGLGWVDPMLVTACIDEALRSSREAVNLRRKAGIVVRSASLRTLHDIILLCGVGADAVNPYAMLLASVNAHKKITDSAEELLSFQVNTLKALNDGLEKVTSTIGCHELRGYGRVFSAIGLAPSVAEVLGTPNFLGSEVVGLTWDKMDQEAAERRAELVGEVKRPQLAKVDRFYPKYWKKVESYALGEMKYSEVLDFFHKLTDEIPVALRHVMGISHQSEAIKPEDVDITIGEHSMPVVIGAMSFGSQGELSYRAYANSAPELNILTVNGEGGELDDLLIHLNPNRGQQVASARFGVNARFLNACSVIEIKIGQGAKPGEGGMLPAYKVTPQVAAARRTNPFVPLISPSNNHDLYSIEDLAELIYELKTVNTQAKVSVKLPVVPNIGVIAVGVAKAGADIINLTGYDGGTGAARKHSLQYVGLPAEIGVVQAHRALTEAGLRDQVELWADGGMKTGEDAIKMILLGANRVGFGTLAMVSIGCTICRKCNEGTCHVGITTHIKTVEEAAKLQLPSFVPRVYDESLHGIVRVFNAVADEMRYWTARLGATRLQDLVGRADLLQQVAGFEKIDLSPMFHPVEPISTGPQLAETAPDACIPTHLTNQLTEQITAQVMQQIRQDQEQITYSAEVMGSDRVLGAHLAGELERALAHQPDFLEQVDRLSLRFGPSSVAGHGLGAFNVDKVDIVVEGGAQDGVAKSANGGRVAVMRGTSADGQRIDGHVGKSFAYGAQRGLLIVQGDADSRACIRFSGADAIFGGEITQQIDDSLGSIGTSANLKGFACEYMTSGRVLIMGDPGPYAFAGMTGGVIYQKLTPELGFDEAALRRRIARGAQVEIQPVDADDADQIDDLLGYYVDALEETNQPAEAQRIEGLRQPAVLMQRFVKLVPQTKK